jgi:hypothetical protein
VTVFEAVMIVVVIPFRRKRVFSLKSEGKEAGA